MLRLKTIYFVRVAVVATFLAISLCANDGSLEISIQEGAISNSYLQAVRRAFASARKATQLGRAVSRPSETYKEALAEAKAELQSAASYPGGHLGINAFVSGIAVNLIIADMGFLLDEKMSNADEQWGKVNILISEAEKLLNSLYTGKISSDEYIQPPIYPLASRTTGVTSEGSKELVTRLGIDISYTRESVFYKTNDGQKEVVEFYRRELPEFVETKRKCGNSQCVSFEKELGGAIVQLVNVQASDLGVVIEIGRTGSVQARF